MGDRVFIAEVCHVWGKWEVRLRERCYLGVRTDAVVNRFGKRERIGGTYSSDWLVGTRATRWSARRLAEHTVRRADRLARRNDASDNRRAAKRERGDYDPIEVSSSSRFRAGEERG